MRYKKIGILGGMGPEATADLYLRIIRIFQKEFGAVYDSDFPEMFIINLPLPDVVENPKDEEEIKGKLVEGVRKLEKAGADFIAVPCNSVMRYIEVMRKAVSVPVLNLIEETANEVKKRGLKKVGLLSTALTLKTGFYQKFLKDIVVLVPDPLEQTRITNIILNILGGKKKDEDKEFIEGLIEKMKNRGAEAVILGCTDLPLLVRDRKDVIDTTEVLARAVVKKAIED